MTLIEKLSEKVMRWIVNAFFVVFPLLAICQTRSELYCFRSSSVDDKLVNFELHT